MRATILTAALVIFMLALATSVCSAADYLEEQHPGGTNLVILGSSGHDRILVWTETREVPTTTTSGQNFSLPGAFSGSNLTSIRGMTPLRTRTEQVLVVRHERFFGSWQLISEDDLPKRGVYRLEIHCFEGNDYACNDTDLPSRITGGLGDDHLVGGLANDSISGGMTELESAYYGGTTVTISPRYVLSTDGTSGLDYLEGRGGDDSLYLDMAKPGSTAEGGDGDDTLYGNSLMGVYSPTGYFLVGGDGLDEYHFVSWDYIHDVNDDGSSLIGYAFYLFPGQPMGEAVH